MNRIKEYFESLTFKGWLKIIIFAILFLFMGGLELGINRAKKTAEENNKPKITEKADETKKENNKKNKKSDISKTNEAPESSEKAEIPKNTYVPATPTIDASEGYGDEWTNGDNYYNRDNTVATSAVNCSKDDVENKIEEILEKDGQFKYDNTTNFIIRDLSSFADQDEKYNNLYSYSATLSYAKKKEIVLGEDTFTKEEGDTAYLKAYATIDGNQAAIHYIVVDGNTLLDDRYVPEDAAEISAIQ